MVSGVLRSKGSDALASYILCCLAIMNSDDILIADALAYHTKTVNASALYVCEDYFYSHHDAEYLLE